MIGPANTTMGILEKLYKNIPDVYARCAISLPDKKGTLRKKKCIINLKTGDVFKKRPLAFHETVNHTLIKQLQFGKMAEITHLAFRNAQIIDDHIVITLWVFADSTNYPNTSKIGSWRYNEWHDIDDAKRGIKKDNNAILNVVVAEPQIAAMIVIDKDQSILCWEDVERYGLTKACYSRERNDFLSADLVHALANSNESKYIVYLTECFKKFFGIGYVGSNKYVLFDTHKDVSAFMRTSSLVMRDGTKQKLVNELTTITLPNYSNASACYKTICYVDRANDEWAVLRWWTRLDPTTYIETSRLYVNKIDIIHCRSDLRGNWIYANGKLKSTTFTADHLVVNSESVFDGTKLEYFKNISTEMRNQTEALYMLVVYPEFEKMYKIGLNWICDEYLNMLNQRSWKNYVEDRLGHVNWDAKSIFKMIGMNNHQVQAVCDFVCTAMIKNRGWHQYCIKTIVRCLKNIFGVDELNDINNETFDYILNSLTNIDRLSGQYYNALIDTFRIYHNNAMYFIRDLNNLINQRGSDTYVEIDGLYGDTISMIQSGNYSDVIRPRFSTLEELIGHHRVMIDLINADTIERNAHIQTQHKEGFKKHSDHWEKLAWDGNDEFCVIAPNEPIDVAIEGITLRHCVKSYIPAVANGNTNIMFIRRKNDIETPFFTAEVDNYQNIRQVHGFGNSNVDSINGLSEFVAAWAKIKKIKYSKSFANDIRPAIE